jgi:hypothetical protein
MSTWIYLQAFVDVALGVGFVLLLADRLRRRTADAWRSEVAGLVDTLGELLVEVERITSGPAPVDTEAAASEVMAEAAPEPAPAPASVTVPEPFFKPVPESEVAEAIETPAAPGGVEAMLAFAHQGLGAEDIARKVGRPVGEVALVLGLRGPQAAGVGG